MKNQRRQKALLWSKMLNCNFDFACYMTKTVLHLVLNSLLYKRVTINATTFEI